MSAVFGLIIFVGSLIFICYFFHLFSGVIVHTCSHCSSWQAEMQELRRNKTEVPSSDYTSASSPYKRLVSENERLKRELKSELSRTEKLHHSLSSTQLQNERLTEEVQHSQSAGPSMLSEGQMRETELMVKVEELQAELEKKTAMLIEVKRHLKEAAEREKNTGLNSSVSGGYN